MNRLEEGNNNMRFSKEVLLAGRGNLSRILMLEFIVYATTTVASRNCEDANIKYDCYGGSRPKSCKIFSQAIGLYKSLNICPSIKTAVQRGYAFPVEAEAIGTSVKDFMKSLNMDRIYDSIDNLLVKYAKLLDFKPVRPVSALEECVDSLYRFAYQDQTHFLARSATLPSESPPCKLPGQAKWQTDKLIK
ncbi:lipopolysaccharide-modifying protein [Tanacetum coccineum]